MRHDIESCDQGGEDQDMTWLNGPVASMKVKSESARAWLKHLLVDSIHSWADFKRIFVGNFQGTYVHPRNSWDLKACK
jgi:hypothetical protein